MKQLIFMLAVCLATGCASTKNTKSFSNPLNGSWVPIKEEMGGKELPAAAFATQKLVINDSLYIFTAESVDKGVVAYNGDKMDIYGREGVNTGRHFTALYKFENGQLTICYNLKGDSYPEKLETTGKPLFFLTVFKKE